MPWKTTPVEHEANEGPTKVWQYHGPIARPVSL